MKIFEIIILILAFISFGCKGEKSRFSIPFASAKKDNIIILNKLTSMNEAERFKVMEEAKRIIENKNIDVNDIEIILTSLQPKNVSTLVFVLMEKQSDTLYKLNIPATKAVENSQGSFPNIAYYYARVNPKKGLPELLRLYIEHGEYRNQICKAIGEVGTADALNFLLKQAREEKKACKQIIPLLAGLQAYKGIIGSKEILFFLEQQVDREEIILLSKLKAEFNQKELFSIWKVGNQKKAYAIEYILNNPSRNFEALKAIVDYELENNKWDNVMKLMMSDNMRRAEDEYIKKYRERIITTIREKKRPMSMDEIDIEEVEEL